MPAEQMSSSAIGAEVAPDTENHEEAEVVQAEAAASPVASTRPHSPSQRLTGSPAPFAKETPAVESVGTYITPELLQLAEELRTVVPQGTWESLGSEEDIMRENASGVQKRPLIRAEFDVSRQVLIRHHSSLTGFVTKEASEDCRDLRPVQNPLYDTLRDEVSIGVQAVPVRREQPAQTHFARRVNAAVQAAPTLVDACIRHIDLPKREAPSMMTFLNSVLPRTLHCLTQNVEVPIYTDDYSMFKEDDVIVGNRDEMILLEKGNYAHVATKDRKITGVDWRSSRARDDYLCIASIAQYSLEERIDAQRRCESSVSLVWELTDPMHPRYILESPNEVQALRFSPSFPNLIAGASMNGQVFLWDLSLADKAPLSMQSDSPSFTADAQDANNNTNTDVDMREVGEVPPMVNSVKGVTWEKDGDILVPHLQPTQMSRVELSHRRPVHDLQWLDAHVECTFDGRQTQVEVSHQFATVSDDGAMLVWDIRPDYLPADKLRKLKHQTKSNNVDVPWVPLLKYQLSKPDGSGDMMGFRFFIDGLRPDDSPSYSVAVGSTTGEIATCNMVTQDKRRGSAVIPTFGNTKETRFVRNVVEAHAGPVYCMQRHPTIGDVFLTCGDHSFKVWRIGNDTPLYRSPYIESGVTCAAWSPARAAIVFIGTADGKIEVWDLLDRNNEPLLVHHMVQDAITVINFKPLPQRINVKFLQHMAIGTNLGSFHWYILPSVLSRAPNGERRQFRSMLEREARRVAYYDWRWTERRKELDRYGVNAPKIQIRASVATHRSSMVDDGFGGTDGLRLMEEDEINNFYAHDPSRDTEFLQLVEELRKAEEEQMRMEAMK